MFISILISAAFSIDTLRAVTVTAEQAVVISRTDSIKFQNPFDISGELNQLPGLQLGDYGGFAGLKSVSLRGMGSPHTAIYVDGLRVSNLQSGQRDMGMLDLENYSSAVVDYAQNSISFNTARPVFSNGSFAGRIGFNMASFGSYMPSARLDFKLSDKMALSVHGAGTLSQGDFPLVDGSKRQNNDMKQLRGAVNLFGTLKNGDYHIRAFHNSSERGTPGTLSWPSEDRQKDMNSYLQGVLRKRFSQLYSLRLSAKAAYDDICYTSSWGDSQYGQTDLQLNSSHVFRIHNWWKLSLNADVQWDKLASSNYGAERFTSTVALATSFRFERLSLNLAAEYAGYFDKGQQQRHALSPSMDFRWRLLEGLELVGFGRRAYRAPMFNELYYIGYGNPELLPEDAWMTDLGIDFDRQLSETLRIDAKFNAFLNLLSNKITSAPTPQDPNIWLPYNIGKVSSSGFDFSSEADYNSGDWQTRAVLRYSYQSAVDKTPDSYSYGQQIPYIARHSITAELKAGWKGYCLRPRWTMRCGRSDATGSLADWNTLDISFSKLFMLNRRLSIELNISAKNVLDCRYELVNGYPMPGRSFVGGILIQSH